MEGFSPPLADGVTMTVSIALTGWFSAACTTEDTLPLAVLPANGFDVFLLDFRLLTPFRPISYSLVDRFSHRGVNLDLDTGGCDCRFLTVMLTGAAHHFTDLRSSIDNM